MLSEQEVQNVKFVGIDAECIESEVYERSLNECDAGGFIKTSGYDLNGDGSVDGDNTYIKIPTNSVSGEYNISVVRSLKGIFHCYVLL